MIDLVSLPDYPVYYLHYWHDFIFNPILVLFKSETPIVFCYKLVYNCYLPFLIGSMW